MAQHEYVAANLCLLAVGRFRGLASCDCPLETALGRDRRAAGKTCRKPGVHSGTASWALNSESSKRSEVERKGNISSPAISVQRPRHSVICTSAASHCCALARDQTPQAGHRMSCTDEPVSKAIPPRNQTPPDSRFLRAVDSRPRGNAIAPWGRLWGPGWAKQVCFEATIQVASVTAGENSLSSLSYQNPEAEDGPLGILCLLHCGHARSQALVPES